MSLKLTETVCAAVAAADVDMKRNVRSPHSSIYAFGRRQEENVSLLVLVFNLPASAKTAVTCK